MIETYKPLPAGSAADRAGTVWIACDVRSCDNEIEVEGVAVRLNDDGCVTFSRRVAAMPEGWVTSNVDDNAISGAAQFCPDHVSMVSTPAE